MANITAKDVADLRAKTGIGMMECKKALVEAEGDVDKAIKILREKGELKAESKMATRIAADGIVDVLKEGDKTAIIEVNTETDFVAKNELFKTFVKNLLKCIIDTNPASVDALLASEYEGVTVDAKLKELIFQIGEKITVRRFELVEGVTAYAVDSTPADCVRFGVLGLNQKYDLILSGDLGKVGSDIAKELFKKEGINLEKNYNDCGLLIYHREAQDVHSGGSGAGCSASVLTAKILPEMEKRKIRKLLFCATGALMSPTMLLQKESIAGICHLVELEI